MKSYWENNGDANAEGKFVYVVENEETGEKQIFEGKSPAEVTDKMGQAQANATMKIRELSGHAPARVTTQTPPKFERRELSADEQFDAGRKLQSPETAAEAVRTIVEAELGAPISQVREQLSAEVSRERAIQIRKAAADFAAATPDFFVCKQNKETIIAYMQTHDLDFGVTANYSEAYRWLNDNRLLIVKPAPTPTVVPPAPPTPAASTPARLATEPAPVTVRPRGVVSATGPRAGDSSGLPARKTPPRYAPDDIRKMDQATLQFKLHNEPGFRELIDSFEQPAPAAAGRR